MTTLQQEVPYFAADVMRILGIRHTNTLRLKIKNGAIPKPDVRLSQKLRYWHRDTLVRAGLLTAQSEPASQPTPAT